MTLNEYKDICKNINLPDTPGVYFFRDGDKTQDPDGNIIYVGKATSLKDRTKSYFSSDLINTRGLKIVNMVLAAKSLTFMQTGSVLEALMLENIEIKKHKPIFNTRDKDDKSYQCVVITKEQFPRVLTMRIRDYEKKFLTSNADVKADKVYGPFSSGTSLKEAVKLIRKIFAFRDKCEVGTGKPCFNAQIGLCPGTCAGLITEEEYKINICNIKNFFEGKTAEIKRDLKRQMEKYSDSLEFEKAAKVRNTLFALDHIRDVSLIEKDETLEWKDGNYRIEAYDAAHISGTSRVGVMTVVINGKKEKSEYKKFKLVENLNDDYAGIVEMLKRRLKHDEWGRPDLIVIDGGVGQKNIAEKVIANLNKNIKIVSVVKDDKHKAREILGLHELDLSKERHEALSAAIILANLEAHRFALGYHVNRRDRI